MRGGGLAALVVLFGHLPILAQQDKDAEALTATVREKSSLKKEDQACHVLGLCGDRPGRKKEERASAGKSKGIEALGSVAARDIPLKETDTQDNGRPCPSRGRSEAKAGHGPSVPSSPLTDLRQALAAESGGKWISELARTTEKPFGIQPGKAETSASPLAALKGEALEKQEEIAETKWKEDEVKDDPYGMAAMDAEAEMQTACEKCYDGSMAREIYLEICQQFMKEQGTSECPCFHPGKAGD